MVLAVLATAGFRSFTSPQPVGKSGLANTAANVENTQRQSPVRPRPTKAVTASGKSAPTYPGCDTPDIVLKNGQRWAACNVGATIAYAGQDYPSEGDPEPEKRSFLEIFSQWERKQEPPSGRAPDADEKAFVGGFFQWGRNEDVTSLLATGAQSPAGSLASAAVGSFVTSNGQTRDWIAVPNGNLWGGGSTSLGSGSHSAQSVAGKAAMRGPCAPGYHVPTQTEWWSAMSSLHSESTPEFKNSDYSQFDSNLGRTLKLPLAGYRDESTGDYFRQGSVGLYWTSSPAGNASYAVQLQGPVRNRIHNFDGTETVSEGELLTPASTITRAYGLSVRCLAN